MDFAELVKMISDNCVTIVIIGYFIFKDWKQSTVINDSLIKLNETVDLVKELLLKKE